MKRMRINRKHVTAFVTAVVLGVTSVGISGCGSSTESAGGNASVTENETDKVESSDGKQVIRIAYLPITHALPVFETEELLDGTEDYEIELVKFGSWSELLDALNSGNVDGASVLIELAMKAYSQGINLQAVALGHHDGNVIVVSDDIEKTEDLKGKTFAIPHRQSSHNILLNETLEQAGLSIEDVNVVELAPTEMPSALASGQIDGYCVAEPFGAQAVSLGVGHVLYDSEELWEDSLCCALVLTGDFIDNQEAVAEEFVNDYKAAGDALDTDTAQTVAEEYLGQDADILKTSLQWISYSNLSITEDEYDSLLEKVKDYSIMDNPPSYEEFVTNFDGQ